MTSSVFVHGTAKRPGHPLALVGEPNFDLRVGDILTWPQEGSEGLDLRIDAIDFWRRSVEVLPRGHRGGLTITGADITLIPKGAFLPKAETGA